MAFSYLSYATNNTPVGNDFTFSGVGIGAADSGRDIIVVVTAFAQTGGNSFPTGVTVGGVSLTEHVPAGGYPGAVRKVIPTVWSGNIPNGTTADIVVSVPDATSVYDNVGIGVYRAVDMQFLDIALDWTSATSGTLNIDTVVGGATILSIGGENTDLDQETDLTLDPEFGTRDFFYYAFAPNHQTVTYSILSEDATETAAYSFTVPDFRECLTCVSFEPTGGGGAGEITGSAYTDGDSFGAGTVSPGAVTVTGAAFSEADVFTAGVVAAFFTITGAAFSDADTFGAGTVAPGAVTISGAVYTDPDSFGSGGIAASGAITGATYTDPDSFGAGTITTGAVGITGAAFTDADTFGSGVISIGGIVVVGAAYTDPDAFGSGTVTTGAVSITGASYSDPDTFGSGALGLSITGAAYTDADSFGSGALSVGATTISGAIYVDADSFGSGAVTGGATAGDPPARRITAAEGPTYAARTTTAEGPAYAARTTTAATS